MIEMWGLLMFILVFSLLGGVSLAILFNYAVWRDRYDGFWDFVKCIFSGNQR